MKPWGTSGGREEKEPRCRVKGLGTREGGGMEEAEDGGGEGGAVGDAVADADEDGGGENVRGAGAED